MADVLNTGGETQSVAPEGHDQAMIDAVEAKEAELAGIDKEAPTEEPEKILGKFDSQEDLVKAYQELERKLSGQSKEEPKEVTEAEAMEKVEAAGLDINAMSDRFAANGSLPDEDYEALEKAGIPRSIVDQYIAGVEATANKTRDSIFAEVGGEEEFNKMSKWAAANMSEQELAQYNQSVESRDPATIRSAVMALAYRYQREVGSEPNLVSGGQSQVGGFGSISQLTEAMKDPRYEKDPAYRREVETKLANSNIF